MMQSTSNKKLQVFVSSTHDDLIKERQAAVEAILTAGHIPAGMELFTSGDEAQMDVIKRWIDESDIYLLILGGRYGSVEPTTGRSYTQLEYEYALAQKKPHFAIVADESALKRRAEQPGGLALIELSQPTQLMSFREDVQSGRMVRFWEDCKDIKIAIGESLSVMARNPELIGWVRADRAMDPGVTNEIARLSQENAQLRLLVDEMEEEPELSADGFRLLSSAADYGGRVAHYRASEGYRVRVGTQFDGEDLIGTWNARESAKWSAALNELIDADFVSLQESGSTSSVYTVSHKGYGKIDSLAK